MVRKLTCILIVALGFAIAFHAHGQNTRQDDLPVAPLAVNSTTDHAVAGESPFADDYDVIKPSRWRTIKLSMDLSHGGRCDITLLRPVPWLAMTKAKVGETLDLHMPEMGISGTAKVAAIEACPEIPGPSKPGWRPVIGKFVTTNARVIELSIEGQDKPIGTTASHPFWSLGRRGWVAAGDLKPGEKLRTHDGSATVKAITPKPGTVTVYNLEVHKDHTFFVSDAKLWVHNGCVDATLSGLKAGHSPGVKVVGSEAELDALYDILSAGGKPVTSPTYNGVMVELSDGTRVGLRNFSTSGGKTIDIHLPNGTQQKVHIE